MKKIKNNQKNLIILLTFAIILSSFSLPVTANSFPIGSSNTDLTPKSSQIISRTVRVAIYNEPNSTNPSYTFGNNLGNNYTAIKTILENAGHEVTELTHVDISDHKLITADFDVFLLADNVPRENITDLVKEFWLGGGSVIGFDSALAYLCYAGIMVPESEGDDGMTTYWDYIGQTVNNFSLRHPVSQSYNIDDTFNISDSSFWATIDWVAIQGTSFASDYYKIATNALDTDEATIVAYDPTIGGGRVIHIVTNFELQLDDLIRDAIDWLCPRPKGRIAFDLSHHPRLAIDDWDVLSAYPGYFEDWRNETVSRKYTFDKLYPSPEGNFTLERLNKYDLLVIVSPDSNFTALEAITVSNWINNGGSLLALGDNPTLSDFAITNGRVNTLITGYDLEFNLTVGLSGLENLSPVSHPTIEGCSDIFMGTRGAVNITGDANSLWEFGGNINVAYQDTGKGRIILCADMNWLTDSGIGNQDNRQFGANMINWLTSDDAEVLLYVDEPDSPNYYITPVSNALNELGINFYLTFSDDYTNLSLNLLDWELLIIDNPWVPGFDTSVLTTVNNFVQNGGRLIMSTYRVNYNPTHPLWARLGFEYDQGQPGSSSLYIWDAAHPIFNLPVDYGAARFDPIRDYGDEGDLLRVYPNATSLAGYTASETENNTNIVLANGGKTLFNGYLIDQFTGDLDDSTYADNFELWINEISFMWAQIIFEPIIDDAIPGYDMYLVSFAIIFSIGVISILKIRKIHKN